MFHVHASLLHRYWESWHYYYMFVNHWYTETLLHWIPLHGYSVHSYFMFLHHCYIDTPVYMHWLSMYACYMDHGLYYCSWIFLYSRYNMTYCYMSNPFCILVTWLFPVLISTFPLLNTWVVDMRYMESHIYCSHFPLYCSCFPLYCSMLSTELRSRSYYHVTCIMYCICSCNIRS